MGKRGEANRAVSRPTHCTVQEAVSGFVTSWKEVSASVAAIITTRQIHSTRFRKQASFRLVRREDRWVGGVANTAPAGPSLNRQLR